MNGKSAEQGAVAGAAVPAMAEWDGDDVPALVSLEALGDDRFRTRCGRSASPLPLYGGLVLAQALGAASATAGGRHVHSLHAYFLRGGIEAAPVDYAVERIRDGRFFSRRRVTASQAGKEIFHLESSFHDGEKGFEHQAPPVPAPPPEACEDVHLLAAANPGAVPEGVDLLAFRGDIIEVRPVGGVAAFRRDAGAARRLWMRVPSAAGSADPAVHAQILAYISDHWLASTALMPHAIALPGANLHLQVNSIDHAMWFHRPVRLDEWLLYSLESPIAQRGTGLVRGQVHDREGRLMASVAQEALLRRR